MNFLLIAVLAAIFLVGLGFVFFVLSRQANKQRLIKQLGIRLFLIRMPLPSGKESDLKEEIGRSEQLFSALASFGEPVIFEAAVPYIGEEICFYGAISNRFSSAFVKQVNSFWPEAEVRPVEDYNIFNYAGAASGFYLKQRQKIILPIRTYQEIGADTFSSVLAGLSKINEVGEGGSLQIILRPDNQKKKEVTMAISALRKGRKFSDILKGGIGGDLPKLSDFTKALGSDQQKEGSKEKKIIDESAIGILEKKLTKPFFSVNVRFVSSAPSLRQAEEIAEGTAAGFAQFGSPERNDFKIIKIKDAKILAAQFSCREFVPSQAMVLNAEELASCFHLPTALTEITKVSHLKFRTAPAPISLPKNGVLIGENVFREEIRPVRISEEDRQRHVYMIGQTGTGKSNLLVNMAKYDMEQGKGLAVIDPHGDLIDEILGFVPANRFQDVIVFDPADISRPIGLNMLEYDFNRPEQKTFIVNEMVSIFDKLYDLKATGGPMFEQYMRNALLLLMEDAVQEPATLMEVGRVFSDAEFRNRKLARIANPTVIDFWEKEAIKAGGEAALSNIAPYVTSKFNNFTANDYMRLIIGQSHSSFNFRTAMDQGKIILINLSKGRIGDLNANLLGLIIVGKILMAALGRTDLPPAQRRDFHFYIDEFQNFTTDSIASILSEARKYRLSLIMAHQFIAQLPENIRDAVFGNIGSLIAFRVGAADADFLAKQFSPVFSERDLVNIDNFNACARLLVNGTTTPPFSLRTLSAGKGNSSQVEILKEASRQAYGRDRQSVENDIFTRLRN